VRLKKRLATPSLHLQRERRARQRTEAEMLQLRRQMNSTGDGAASQSKLKAYDQIMTGLVKVRCCLAEALE